jgi:hypothetical protein
MTLINVITPVSRPGNIWTIGESIQGALKNNPHNHKIAWWVVLNAFQQYTTKLDLDVVDDGEFACTKNAVEVSLKAPHSTEILVTGCRFSVAGSRQRNFALDHIDEGLVWMLDDDNLMHPDFLNYPYETGKFYALPQQLNKYGSVRMPTSFKVCDIDQAQLVYDRKLLGGLRQVDDYCCDGHMIEAVHKAVPDAFVPVFGVRAYYNKLRWEE